MEKNNVFLMHDRRDNAWYVLERDFDIIGKWENGRPSVPETDVVYEAADLSDLLHRIQKAEDWRFYVTLGWINSKRHTREDLFRTTRELHVLMGFIPEVCDIRTQNHFNAIDDSKWEVAFATEMWVQTDENTVKRVSFFREKMKRDAMKYISDHGLEFDEE